MKRLALSVAASLLALGAFAAPKRAQEGAIQGQPWTGGYAVEETVSHIMQRQMREAHVIRRREEHDHPNRPNNLPQNPYSPFISQWPAAPAATPAGAILPPVFTLGAHWNGIDFLNAGQAIPPDNMMSVGPSQVVVDVNSHIRVFSKAGALGALDADTNTFFGGIMPSGFATSDPEVRFDPLTSRWFVVCIDFDSSDQTAPNDVLLAVSSGPTITNSTSFSFFHFKPESVGTTPNADTGLLADRPSLGVDNKALYIGFNMFNASSAQASTSLYVVRKSSILSTGPIVVTPFRSLSDSNENGMYNPCGVDNFDPASTVGHVVAVDEAKLGSLIFATISDPGGTPSMSTQQFVTVPATAEPIPAPALGSDAAMDTDDDRIWNARIDLNRVTGKETLWCAQNIGSDASGIASSSPSRDAIRWYQFSLGSSTPVLLQSGTMFDSSATHPRFFYYPGIAMNGEGDMAVASTVSSDQEHAEVAVATRAGTDAGGVLRPVSTAIPSTFTYNQFGTRWGDYSYMCIDPTDGMTLWAAEEFTSQQDDWCTEVIQLLSPPPAAIVSISPNTIAEGATTDVTVTGQSSNGSQFFDGGSAFTKHINAAFGQGGITVNSVQYIDPTHVQLSVTVGSTAIRNHDLTISNPDGQTSTLAGALNVDIGGGPFVQSIDLPSAFALGGTSFSATVTLTSAAPTGGSSVSLSSSKSVVTVPASTLVAETATVSPKFNISTQTVTSSTAVTLSATLNGLTTNTTLTLTPPAATLILPVTSIVGGNVLVGATVKLDQAAGSSAVTVGLSSDTPSAFPPSHVTVAAGASVSSPFNIPTAGVATTTHVNLTALYNGIKRTVTLTISPASPVSVTFEHSSVGAGVSQGGAVHLNGAAPPDGASVALTYSSGIANGPASTTVQGGHFLGPIFVIKDGAASVATQVKVTATFNNVSASGTYTVNPPFVSTFALNEPSVHGGQQAGCTITLSGPVASDTAVQIKSGKTSVVPAQTVTVFANSTTGIGSLTTNPVTSTTTVTVAATLNGGTKSASLTVTPPVLESVNPNSGTVTGGSVDLAGVQLDGEATANLLVSLASSNTSAATVPKTVQVNANTSTGGFSITTFSVSAATPVTITAALNGVQKTASITVEPPNVTGFNLFGNSSLISGQTAQGQVTISAAAGQSGLNVPLTSSNTAAVSVPAFAFVPAGSTTSNKFTITANTVNATATSTVSAQLGNSGSGVLITVSPFGISQVSIPGLITEGDTVQGSVTLAGNIPNANQVVSLQSSDPILSIPSTVTVLAGKTGVSFNAVAGATNTVHNVTITATLGGNTQTGFTTVTPPIVTVFSFSPNPVTGGSSTVMTITLSKGAPAGGETVTLAANPPSLVTNLPPTVQFAQGVQTVKVTLTTASVTSQQTVSMSAQAGNSTTFQNLTINP